MQTKQIYVQIFAAVVCATVVIGGMTDVGVAQGDLKVRVDRWMQVSRLAGRVSLSQNRQQRPAQMNDRLQAVGDGITTAERSLAQLDLDTGIGTIEVAANTAVQIKSMGLNSDQSRTTRMAVSYGRVKLKVRRFSNPNSRLEIETPAGISGVRGTEFAIAVQPTGKTAVAVSDGAVNTNAQGQDVLVPAGFQNFTIPGEPPSTPVALRDDPQLNYQLEKRIVGGQRRLRLIGQVDAVNMVYVDGRTVDVDREGKFSVDIKLVSFPKLNLLVQTPLGREQSYDLAL
jgi:hypothetical protein